MKKVMDEIVKQVKNLLQAHQPEIEKAYIGTEKDLCISFKVKLKGDSKKVDVTTDLKFTESEVKDKAQETIHINQENLFKGENENDNSSSEG